ncbi:MAG: GNAT family N-acetyltransferase [Alistipes sp.]|nr:GNAT family N-acetyltransferase [Alistipes sp.]
MDRVTIRKAAESDADAILEVYEASRRYMRATGNLTQWSDGYPARADVMADIAAGNCYVGLVGEEIVMAFAFIIGDDATYRIIEQGSWLDDRPYGTIHRLGSTGRQGGMLAACVEFCFTKIDNLRLDTHSDNRPMLEAVGRLGFERCGIIYCRDGSPRIAFQKRKTKIERNSISDKLY